MANENAKKHLIAMIFGTWKFSGSLITNPRLKFRNSKWRTKTQKVTWLGWYLVLQGFRGRSLWIRVRNLEIQNNGCNMADENTKSYFDWDDNLYSGVFEVADYESKLNIQKVKMSDAIRRTRIQKTRSYAAKVFLRHTFFTWFVFRPNTYIYRNFSGCWLWIWP